jgi:signal transduction histidine kinase
LESEDDSLYAELVRRAASLARGARSEPAELRLPASLARRVDAAEQRARSVADAGGGCEESRRAAALDFVAGVATTLGIDSRTGSANAGRLASAAASAIGVSRRAARVAVFRRALGAPEVSALAPAHAYRFVLSLILELVPAEAVSLWTSPAPGRVECIASAGRAATSRRMRLAARAVFEGGAVEGAQVRGVAVRRWDRPHAALVARGHASVWERLGVYLTDAGAALAPFFERETLFERNAAREQLVASASERRLTRLGCDLHDGPLQEIVALADDLRRTRDQVARLLDADLAAHVRGRFDDLEARLAALDRGLRDVSNAVRSTGTAERLELGLRTEVDAFNRAGTVQAQLSVLGDFSDLTASQSIVCFRVVQESLSNTRRHSGATNVRVRVRSTPRYVSVTVSDNGCGFDVETARRSGRLGLTGLIERVELLGGDIEFHSKPGEGTRVRVTLPHWSRPAKHGAAGYAVTA